MSVLWRLFPGSWARSPLSPPCSYADQRGKRQGWMWQSSSCSLPDTKVLICDWNISKTVFAWYCRCEPRQSTANNPQISDPLKNFFVSSAPDSLICCPIKFEPLRLHHRPFCSNCQGINFHPFSLGWNAKYNLKLFQIFLVSRCLRVHKTPVKYDSFVSSSASAFEFLRHYW